MYDAPTRALARQAIDSGESLNSISRRLGISRSTLRSWRDSPADPPGCPRCEGAALEHPPYAHLLGLYLGDGCISFQANGVQALRIACDTAYPRLIDAAATVVRAVHAHRPVHRVVAVGYTSIVSYWKHWTCLFPSTAKGRSICVPSRSSPGNTRSLPSTPSCSCAVCSTPTVAALRTGRLGRPAASPSGTSIRGTSSPTSRPTSCGCASRHSTSSASRGACHAAMPCRSRDAKVLHGSTSSSGRRHDEGGQLVYCPPWSSGVTGWGFGRRGRCLRWRRRCGGRGGRWWSRGWRAGSRRR